jgi:hypothetical protein
MVTRYVGSKSERTKICPRLSISVTIFKIRWVHAFSESAYFIYTFYPTTCISVDSTKDKCIHIYVNTPSTCTLWRHTVLSYYLRFICISLYSIFQLKLYMHKRYHIRLYRCASRIERESTPNISSDRWVSNCCLTQISICSAISWWQKYTLDKMIMISALYPMDTLSLIVMVPAYWNNSPRVDRSLHWDTSS